MYIARLEQCRIIYFKGMKLNPELQATADIIMQTTLSADVYKQATG